MTWKSKLFQQRFFTFPWTNETFNRIDEEIMVLEEKVAENGCRSTLNGIDCKRLRRANQKMHAEKGNMLAALIEKNKEIKRLTEIVRADEKKFSDLRIRCASISTSCAGKYVSTKDLVAAFKDFFPKESPPDDDPPF